MRYRLLLSLLTVLGTLFVSACDNREGDDTVEQQAIRSQSKAYVKAFNERNAEVIADLWTEDARYTDPETGVQLDGKDAIKGDFEELFSEDTSTHIELHISSIDVLNGNKAIETGTATISREDDESTHTAYKAFYEKIQGNWLLSEVREVEFELPSSNFEYLKDLEWLVGEWVDEDEDTVIRNKFEWNDNKNYITQHFTVTAEGQKIQEGKQIIAWDPALESVRSWIFDSDGGFGEGIWVSEDDRWSVETSFTLPDGRRASAINIYTKVSDSSFTWESTGREVAGEIIPSIGPVIVERVAN